MAFFFQKKIKSLEVYFKNHYHLVVDLDSLSFSRIDDHRLEGANEGLLKRDIAMFCASNASEVALSLASSDADTDLVDLPLPTW